MKIRQSFQPRHLEHVRLASASAVSVGACQQQEFLGVRAAAHRQGRCGVGSASGWVLSLSPVAGRSYSQAQIAGIGTACNVGGYMPIVAGLFYDKLKRYNS